MGTLLQCSTIHFKEDVSTQLTIFNRGIALKYALNENAILFLLLFSLLLIRFVNEAVVET